MNIRISTSSGALARHARLLGALAFTAAMPIYGFAQTQSSLLVEVDEESEVSVDGETVGPIRPDEAKKVPVTLGDHRVVARKASGETLRLTIRVDSDRQQICSISFANSRAQASRAAAEAAAAAVAQAAADRERKLEAEVQGRITSIKNCCGSALSAYRLDEKRLNDGYGKDTLGPSKNLRGRLCSCAKRHSMRLFEMRDICASAASNESERKEVELCGETYGNFCCPP